MAKFLLVIQWVVFIALVITLINFVRVFVLTKKWKEAIVLLYAPREKPHKSIFGDVENIEVKGRLDACEELKGLGEINVSAVSKTPIARWVPRPGTKLELVALCGNGSEEVWTYYYLTLQDGTKKLLLLQERLPQQEAVLQICET
ncbi:MAG: hypothetical protein ACPLQP_00965 [Moorellaceae bacterium]